MMWFHGCPKCQGDLYLENDVMGTYIVCAQCGHNLTPVEEAELKARRSVRRRELVGAAARDGAKPARAA